MKKVFSATLVLLLILSVLSGCQKTPDSPIVIGKGDGKLEEKLSDSRNTEQPKDMPRNGERIQDSFSNSNGTINITVDAQMLCYGTDTFPAAEVLPQPFSQEQADKIITALTDGAPLYGNETTKESIERLLLEYKQLAGTAGNNQYDSIISDLEEQHKTAPSSNEVTANTIFSKQAAASSAHDEGILVRFDHGIRSYMLSIQNDDTGRLSYAELTPVGSTIYSVIGNAEDTSYSIDISHEEVQNQAERIVAEMGSDLMLYESYIVRDDAAKTETYAYQFVFTRAINSFHTVYDASTVIDADISEETKSQLYQEPWPYEYLILVIDKDGIQKMEWKSPQIVEKTINDNVTLLAYPEIMNIFKKMATIKNTAWETFLSGTVKSISVHIDRITLGLTRVQSGESYYLIPAWDFYGSVTYLDENGKDAFDKKLDNAALFSESLRSILTINAVDGTIIDRSLGY